MSDKIVRASRAALVQAQAQAFLDQGVITPAHTVLPPAPQSSSQISIEWVNAYSDQASQAQSDKTGVLVFCSSRRPGGGWLNGAKAQEEDISLASTWAVQAAASDGSFYQDSDGVGNNMALMADGLWLHDPAGHPLHEPLPVVFAGVAAPNRNAEQVGKLSTNQQITMLSDRLRAAFEGWHQHGVSTVVVGAIGCGVFKWDPQDSAQALKQALEQTQWKGKVVCAIPDDRVLGVFKEIFYLKIAKSSMLF